VNFRRLKPVDYWQGALPASTATWNLHTTQTQNFAPTYSEVVNLTGLAENKEVNCTVWKMMGACSNTRASDCR